MYRLGDIKPGNKRVNKWWLTLFMRFFTPEQIHSDQADNLKAS